MMNRAQTAMTVMEIMMMRTSFERRDMIYCSFELLAASLDSLGLIKTRNLLKM